MNEKLDLSSQKPIDYTVENRRILELNNSLSELTEKLNGLRVEVNLLHMHMTAALSPDRIVAKEEFDKLAKKFLENNKVCAENLTTTRVEEEMTIVNGQTDVELHEETVNEDQPTE